MMELMHKDIKCMQKCSSNDRYSVVNAGLYRLNIAAYVEICC